MYPKLGQFKTPAELAGRFAELGIALPLDEAILTAEAGSPLAAPIEVGGLKVGNRWCIHPMEGWDANVDGTPSPWVLRRWRRFGISGAKLIWGGEAAAVVPEGRANPRQTLATPENLAGLKLLCHTLRAAHAERFGRADDLVAGLQLTHSGRFCQPQPGPPRRRIAFHHPLLDRKFGIAPDDRDVLVSDAEAEALVERFVVAAQVAAEAGFDFVDIKACHGYLLHEFLGAHTRPGPFGGDFAGRTRLLTTIVAKVQQRAQPLRVGVRLSAFDTAPFVGGREVGRPMPYQEHLPYRFGFGVDRDDPLSIDLSETIALLKLLGEMGVAMVNLTAGSPYYNPHVQRPAIFPPSDGYLPPEDPLRGVWRQIDAVRRCKDAVPGLPLVGSGYSYLQDYLVHAAQAVVRLGWVDFVGLGRMVLSYPELPADALQHGALKRKRICRTFSDCTTAPRHGLISGCYPLDPDYKSLPEAAELARRKGG